MNKMYINWNIFLRSDWLIDCMDRVLRTPYRQYISQVKKVGWLTNYASLKYWLKSFLFCHASFFLDHGPSAGNLFFTFSSSFPEEAIISTKLGTIYWFQWRIQEFINRVLGGGYNFWGFEIVLMPLHTYPMLL